MKEILCKKLAEVTKILCKLRHSVKHREYLENNNHKALLFVPLQSPILEWTVNKKKLSLNGFLFVLFGIRWKILWTHLGIVLTDSSIHMCTVQAFEIKTDSIEVSQKVFVYEFNIKLKQCCTAMSSLKEVQVNNNQRLAMCGALLINCTLKRQRSYNSH